MLNNTLLEILVCPKCKGELDYRVDEHNDRNGKLVCANCNLAYPIQNDIPKLLIDEAEKLAEKTTGGAPQENDNA